MSILQRLLVSISLAMGVILLGTLGLNVTAARNYLSDQLLAQSNDTAVSLALSLSQPGNDDPVIQELLVSALFDGGRFSLVQLQDPQGRPLVIRRMESAAPSSVPEWFRALVPLSARSATHSVTDGWRQIGTLTVTADDAYAWETLWRSSLRMIALVIGAGVLWALFAFALVRWIKRRLLSDVGEQLRAIGQGQLDKGPVTPSVSEFSDVADALNQTQAQLRMTAEERTRRIEKLEVELNRDPVTGLANRKYFLNSLRQAVDDSIRSAGDGDAPSNKAVGHVLAFRQRDLAAINRHMPRDLVDQWLATLCSRLNQVLLSRNLPGAVLARLNGSDFALLLPRCQTPAAMMMAERLRTELRTARIPVGDGGRLCRWAQALTDYGPGSNAGDVLARLDNALMRAESAGSDHVNFTPDDGPAGQYRGESAWQVTIQSALADHRFALTMQELRGRDGQPVGHEGSLVLLAEDGDTIPATLFIPAAVRLDLAGSCDAEAVRLGLRWLQANPGELMIRMSLPSLLQAGFLEELDRALAGQPGDARRLVLEIDAHGVIERYDEVRALCRMAATHGVRVGLRRLAHQLSALTRLHDLPIAYVKMGGGFLTDIAHNPGSQALLRSVLEIARSRDITVYAEDVADTPTQDYLQGSGVVCTHAATVSEGAV